MVGVILAKTLVYSRFHAGNVFVVWKCTNLGSFLQFADGSRSRVVLLLLNFSRINSQWAWSTQRARRSCEGLLLDDGSHWNLFIMMNFQLTCPQRINTCHYFRNPPSISKHLSKCFCFASVITVDQPVLICKAKRDSFNRCIGHVLLQQHLWVWEANALVWRCCQENKKIGAKLGQLRGFSEYKKRHPTLFHHALNLADWQIRKHMWCCLFVT